LAPDEFLARAQGTVDKLALAFAGESDVAVERKLEEFAQGVRTGWREAFRGLVHRFHETTHMDGIHFLWPRL